MSKQESKKLHRQSEKLITQNSFQLQTRPFKPTASQIIDNNKTTPSDQSTTFKFDQFSNRDPVSSLPLAGSPIQAKLTIGQPGDKYEQEADRVAANVVNQINSPKPVQQQDDIQRHVLDNTERQLPLQRRGTVPVGPTTDEFETNLNSARSGGNTLAPKVQTQMGAAMGADFSGVKVHTDTQADQLNRSIQAKAFTTGQDVFFRQGAYQPESREGQELIAHELTHVVQQSGTQRAPVQRKLSNEKIEEYKEILGLENASIVEMPKGGPKVVDPFSTYPDTSLYNLPSSLSGKSLLNVAFQMTDEVAKSDEGLGMDGWEYYAGVTANEYLNDSNGGGAFIAPYQLAVLCEGAPNRALLHEMGHAEQQERLGAQFGGDGTTVNQIILEYHNVMTNENLYDLVDTDKGYDELDVRTFYNKSNLNKHKDKTWQDLMQAAIQEHPLNRKLLYEIKELIDLEAYAPWAKETEKNLISEYFVNVGG